jgi:DNA (cytosine-5)-methyltransferase 1
MAEDISTVAARLNNGKPYKSRLIEAIARYPTMSANGMGNTGSQQILQRRVDSGELTIDEKKAMTAGRGGKLNPTWVEWLMGFPTGWTDLED